MSRTLRQLHAAYRSACALKSDIFFRPSIATHHECYSSEAAELQHKKTVNRLIYRSKQRGFLELDLLVGEWAEKSIPKMRTPELEDTETMLNEENPDLWKWLTGQLPPPERLISNVAFLELRSIVQKQMADLAPAATLAKPGVDWVRGWDDGNWKGKMPDPSKRSG